MKCFEHQLRISTVLILSGVISTLSMPGFATTYYRITDLGDLPEGTDFSVASGINEVGQIVGSMSIDGVRHAYRLTLTPSPMVASYIVYV